MPEVPEEAAEAAAVEAAEEAEKEADVWMDGGELECGWHRSRARPPVPAALVSGMRGCDE